MPYDPIEHWEWEGGALGREQGGSEAAERAGESRGERSNPDTVDGQDLSNETFHAGAGARAPRPSSPSR